jgi:tRNA(adenine34) deaminase
LKIGILLVIIRFIWHGLSMNDEHYMKRALELAKKGEQLGEVPVGAVLVLNDEIIVEAYNQPIAEDDPTAHAEILALREGGKKLENYRLLDTTLYVTLEPCAMCAQAMVHARIKRIVYATSDHKTGVIDSHIQLLQSSTVNWKIESTAGVCAEEASQMLSKFFAKRRRSKD